MKASLLISTLFLSINLFAQTPAIEEANWNRRLAEKEKSPEEMRNLINEWLNLIDSYGGYPKLPYNDSTKEIEYTIVRNCNYNKEVIINRILEWAALSFGSLDAVLHYRNDQSGKIILKGSFRIFHKMDYRNFWGEKKESTKISDCYQTYTFTVKDNKFKIQISSIKIEYTSGGYSTGSFYIPETKTKFDINYLYPVSNFDPIDWKQNLDILYQLNRKLILFVADLDKYIKEYSNDYSF